MMASRDAIHPLRNRRREGGGMEEKITFLQDFGLYQICLLAATQISYMPIAASILSSSFMKRSEGSCALLLEARNSSVSGTNGTNGTNRYLANTVPSSGEFFSLLTLWDLDCTEDAVDIQTTISIMVMIGGLFGASIAGFVADRYGRKPVMTASLALCSLSNAALLLSSFLSWPLALPIFTVLGAACGGYMTTNLVLVVESLCLPSSRLLVVALNGWSLSMAGTALLAFMCPNWFQYHLSVAIISLICAVGLFFIADESLRWLKSSHKVTRFDRASSRLIRLNRGETFKDIPLLCQLEKDGAAAAAPVRPLAARESDESYQSSLSQAPSLSYFDLLKERSLRPRLLSLAYCFFSSSVVSFGFYFAIDSLSGNRCANMAAAGSGKFVLGLIPFVFSSCASRKQVALVSVAASATAAWVVLACLLAGLPLQSLAIMLLSILATAALDPNWKISHLYSTEMFPTNMRNMARGLCNSAGRFGSVIAPLLSHFRHAAPYVYIGIFAVLLTAQFAITAIFLPNQMVEAKTVLPSTLQDAVPAVPSDRPEEERRRKAKRSEYDEDDDARSREDSSQLSETAPLTP
ncbi:hypothetical protein PRIPAC_74504 [Pristionchus pacificus]|uniref:Membrane transporter n=1 Tax=Pristionchus pacificus TaxID=54126 RepID=A0A2A6B4E5_PRIPA|nr:hypothetical protein PRIPAC_74504 [Pristionchus pacificus]|eukprot:PDM60750.1 membrane transporter [Pristionchus pacificus]